MKKFLPFIILCSIAGPILVHADFSSDGVNGFMTHWANYNADSTAANAEYAAMQNDLNDNSQTAQDMLAANPSLNQSVQALIPQFVANPDPAIPVLSVQSNAVHP